MGDLRDDVVRDMLTSLREASDRIFPHLEEPWRYPWRELAWRSLMSELGRGLTPEEGGEIWLNPIFKLWFETHWKDFPSWVRYHYTAPFGEGIALYVINKEAMEAPLLEEP